MSRFIITITAVLAFVSTASLAAVPEFTLASGDSGDPIITGATLYSDAVGEEVLGVEPGDGGNVIVVWPEAPQSVDGGNIVLIWPEAPQGADGGNIVLIWPRLDKTTDDYTNQSGVVCGVDATDKELWCIDTADGDYENKDSSRPMTWDCAPGAWVGDDLPLHCTAQR